MSKSYYENLYKSTHPNIEEAKTYIDNTKINKKFRMEESLICEGKLNIEECTNAIFKIRLNRSPGYDGTRVEFYRQFWESLKDFIVPVFNYNYDRKELTQSQKLGMLTLIYNKNLSLIQDFKLGGGALKNIAQSGGRREIFGVFCVKNHDFTPKNLIFSNFRKGARARCTSPGPAPVIPLKL